ncbi:MAG: methylated-DNA--[protein]-cysteine S-methyltransferase [Acidimicrobiaceae bacterium]|nr:methylated-DNA--[protein]-cysteine S-methyltransferase [Acidimicrobiaceae bacterium]
MASAGRDIPVDLARFTSPFGTILYAHSETGLAALCFGEELEELSIPSRFQPSGKEVPSEIIENALTGYFDGSPIALDQVDLDLAETGFYSLCRAELRRVPFGETVTYKGLAALAGNPKAHRAAASACSTNPIPLFVPCHRVVSSDGSLGGYAFGTALKASLLEFEAISVGY